MDPKSPGADAAWARLTAEPDQQTSLIEKIAASLGRVDDGTYGIDERTGEPIEPARLGEPIGRTNISETAEQFLVMGT